MTALEQPAAPIGRPPSGFGRDDRTDFEGGLANLKRNLEK